MPPTVAYRNVQRASNASNGTRLRSAAMATPRTVYATQPDEGRDAHHAEVTGRRHLCREHVDPTIKPLPQRREKRDAIASGRA